MHNTANQQVKTRCIFCGTQRIVLSKNPSDLCSLIIFPPKNMPGGTLYKKKKTRILTFISTSLKGKLQYKQKQSGYDGQSSQRIYLSDLTTNQLTSVANTKLELKKTIFWNKKPNWNPPETQRTTTVFVLFMRRQVNCVGRGELSIQTWFIDKLSINFGCSWLQIIYLVLKVTFHCVHFWCRCFFTSSLWVAWDKFN